MKPVLNVVSISVVGPGHLRVQWSDGVVRVVDVSAKLCGHPVLDMLNVPEVFRDVSVVQGGGGIEWANGADFSARSLRIWSDEQLATDRKTA